jgi:ribosomal protein S18 acetylase RimI-like enzyme
MTQAPCEIRRYRPADKNEVWRVHDRAFRASPMDFLPHYNRELRHIEDSYLTAGGEFLIGLLGDRPGGEETLVACGGYLPTGAPGATHGSGESSPGGEKTVELRSVRVDPDHQRRGIGRAIVFELETRAREAGFEAVLVETVESLRGALGLYRSLGYEVSRRLTDADRTRVTLERPLQPRD